MKLLLDTHAFIWAAVDPDKLPKPAHDAIAELTNDVFVSAATAWEIAIKRAIGRLKFPIERFDALITEMGFDSLAMTAAHCVAAGGLPRHHNDPFDRMLIAQARLEGLSLVTLDDEFRKYDILLLDLTGG